MKEIFTSKQFWIVTVIVFGVALLRLVNLEWHNFAPIGAIALFGAAYFRKVSVAFIIPVAALLFSDLLIQYFRGDGFYTGMQYVYISFLMIGAIGLLLRDNVRVHTVLGASLGASVLFFLVTNFGAWLGNPLYPQHFGGLIMSFEAGLPFFRPTLLGDLVYSVVLFGAFELATRKVHVLQRAK